MLVTGISGGNVAIIARFDWKDGNQGITMQQGPSTEPAPSPTPTSTTGSEIDRE
jgi:hypothetical protein